MFKQRQDYFRKMEKLRKENPDKFYAFTSDFAKLNKTLSNAKDKIKKFFQNSCLFKPRRLKFIRKCN